MRVFIESVKLKVFKPLTKIKDNEEKLIFGVTPYESKNCSIFKSYSDLKNEYHQEIKLLGIIY